MAAQSIIKNRLNAGSCAGLFEDVSSRVSLVPQTYCLIFVAPEISNFKTLTIDAGSTSRSVETVRAEEALAFVYQLEKNKQGRLAARHLMIFLELSFKKRNLSYASALIEHVELDNLGVHSLLGLVRTTARAKSSFPSWASLYKRTKETVQRKGYSADQLFVGISKIDSPESDEKSN